MARTTTPPPEDFTERIVDIEVEQEMQEAFLEYAYSVIYSRALPDARDGLKPVQRRILFQMAEMGLRPDRAHVKSARVVGDVMGRLHPHGDAAIYDALVRLAQDFTLRVPLVDGHGNFGSLDDGPAAARYTEVRMAPPALVMTDGLDEDTVDFVPNYDNTYDQPAVLPSAIPNLLVNGASGIAVGMATNMPPHNLVEIVGAARHLIAHPEAGLDDLMRFVPGPDLPTGGKIVGLEGVREAYASGRGSFRTRATARIENVTARRKAIVVTELPYTVGPEKVIEKVQALVQAKKLQGISDLADYTDRDNGLRLVIEIKNGFNPDAVLEQLYRLTPMEESFGINNVCLVEGQPRTLGLKDLLQVYVDHRIDVVRRRSLFRRTKAADRLHLVEGLLVAILDIDEVIAVIRSSDDTAQARERLMGVFDLTQVQTDYILEMPLRRLTKYSKLELDKEKAQLEETIAGLTALLESEALLRRAVSDELAEVAKSFGTPRRTVLLESAGTSAVKSTAAPLEVADDPCFVLLSSTGLLVRTSSAEPLPPPDPAHRSAHDVVVACVPTTARGEVAAVTSSGRMVRLPVLDMPALPPTSTAPSLSGGAPLAEFLALGKNERVVTLASLGTGGAGLALGTAQGIVKRVTADYPSGKTEWEVIALRDGDSVVGAVELPHERCDLVFVTSDAQLLRFGAEKVRPQGRAAGGMSGVSLAPRASVISFGAVDLTLPDGEWASVVVTVAGATGALPGTQTGTPRSRRTRSTRRRAGRPAACAATGSSRARTPCCSPGPGPCRRSRRARTASPSRSPSRTRGGTGREPRCGRRWRLSEGRWARGCSRAESRAPARRNVGRPASGGMTSAAPG